MKRILVLGSSGMLGYMVFKILSGEENFEVQGTQSENKNLPHYFNVEDGVKEEFFNDYDYLINCVGILSMAIDARDSISVARAIRINALFPHELAVSTQAKIIHISTDGVFSGRPSPQPNQNVGSGLVPGRGGAQGLALQQGQGEGYDEDAPHDCPDVYGKTKSLGEVIADNVLNIRTSIIGPSPLKKQGLLEWFLSQPEGGTISGYTNHVWSGATTLQYAQLCAKIIKEDAFNQLRAESSVFHFAPNQPVTKYELLNLFKLVFKRDVTINPVEDPKCPIARILKTKYEGLKKLFPDGIPMRQAIEQLKILD